MSINWVVLIGSGLLTAAVIQPIFGPLFMRFKKSIPLIGYVMAALGAGIVVSSAIFFEALARSDPQARPYIQDFLLCVASLISASYIAFLKADDVEFVRKHKEGFNVLCKTIQVGFPVAFVLFLLLTLVASSSWTKPLIILGEIFLWVFGLIFPGFLFIDDFKKVRDGETIPRRFDRMVTLSAYWVLTGVRFLCDKSLDIQRDTPQAKAREARTESGDVA